MPGSTPKARGGSQRFQQEGGVEGNEARGGGRGEQCVQVGGNLDLEEMDAVL